MTPDVLALCRAHLDTDDVPAEGPEVPAGALVAFARDLHALGFDFLVTAMATHVPATDAAPESTRMSWRVRRLPAEAFAFHVCGGPDVALPSLAGVWAGAEWQEREAWDLVGVAFAGHPDLRRILLPDDWDGHPLRKDYAIDTRVPPWR